MAEHSEISWTDATFNPWIGCTRVSPGCDHCYAARDNERRKWVSAWGAERRRTKTWGDPLRWNRKAAETGYRPRVFCASLADVFDNEVDDAWRTDLWQLLRETPNLRWMLLTKRIGNVLKMVPADWPFDAASWEWLDWVITGDESGADRRPLDMDAVRDLRDQCSRLGIAFHHKQNGGVRGKDNGCLVDGEEHKHFPQALAA